jgi:tripartite-type tricarboxylate transporter receptor subunit TctC
MFNSVPLAHPYIDAGRLRALAVTSPERSALLPGVPAMYETGLAECEFVGWFAIMVANRTSPRIIAWLNQALVGLLAGEDVKRRIEAIGAEPVTSAAADVGVLMRRDSLRWQRVVQAAKVKLDWEDQPP